MRPSPMFSWKAALVAALLLVGVAGAKEAGPAPPAAVPQIQKMTIYNGSVPTVSYSVQGGSPHLQALVQSLQFTENEVNLTSELQKLRLGIVANEQILDRVRTSQALGLGPISTPSYAAWPPDSGLSSALVPGLAREATPATAYELINLWERLQTEVQAEQARVAGIVHAEPPAGQNAPPSAPATAPGVVPQPAASVAALPAARIMVPALALPQQTVRQNQDQARQQIMQALRQVFQSH